ncbi:adenylate/guanylate cyclase domain-containing protein [Neolewinella antarctica]|uniref:Class 3 adenylate cyclase n=1 Tax=Neolewinella antarctica TaxID=442734 RepID=A0ABX0XFJ5_9BACT|nr:adenylate/guanylate cyclase domain-containing protein [Neolewinella antarctica]NJC28090.1 class 3 adenylate cyclase [Neolewinella antarctica]
MPRLPLLLCFLALLPCTRGLAQTNVEENVHALELAKTDLEAYGILYEIVETMLASEREQDGGTTVNMAKKLTHVADQISDPTLTGPAYFQLAQAHQRDDETQAAERALEEATNQAMDASNPELILRAAAQNSRLKAGRGRYREANESTQRALDYFIRRGDEGGMARLRSDLVVAKARLLRQQEDITAARARLDRDLAALLAERKRITSENNQRDRDLKSHLNELSKTKEQKAVVEQHAESTRADLRELSREALEQNTLATTAREEVARQRLDRQASEMRAQQQSFRLYTSLGAALILALLAGFFYNRTRAKTRAAAALELVNQDLREARRQSDSLLENILPADVAQELKATGKAKARSFPQTTILFCDFVNFTSIAEQLGAEALVRELDKCFRGFDRIVDEYAEVEKIKTVGDAYMVASGLAEAPGPPVAIIKVALAMQAFLREEAGLRRRSGVPFFTGRVGLHTGPVVAGVVGERKFSYDVWGDTVNLAARIEANSEPGKVNISASTHALVRNDFYCTYRGQVEAKNKGLVHMYYVDACVPTESGRVPGQREKAG